MITALNRFPGRLHHVTSTALSGGVEVGTFGESKGNYKKGLSKADNMNRARTLRASPKTGLSTLFTRRASSSSSSGESTTSAEEVSMNSGLDRKEGSVSLCVRACVRWESLCVSGGLPFCGHPSEDYLSFPSPLVCAREHGMASHPSRVVVRW